MLKFIDLTRAYTPPTQITNPAQGRLSLPQKSQGAPNPNVYVRVAKAPIRMGGN